MYCCLLSQPRHVHKISSKDYLNVLLFIKPNPSRTQNKFYTKDYLNVLLFTLNCMEYMFPFFAVALSSFEVSARKASEFSYSLYYLILST